MYQVIFLGNREHHHQQNKHPHHHQHHNQEEKKYEEAIKNYTKAVEKLQYISKLDESPLNKETYKKKAKEYYDRAMELKNAATSKEENKKQAIADGDK